MRRTRIVATVGPSCQRPPMLARMADAGVDAFRVNFSHGDDASHRAALRAIGSLPTRPGREIARIADLQGPKLRLGALAVPHLVLADGAEWRLDRSDAPGSGRRASVSSDEVLTHARPGDPILLGDGNVELVAVRREAGTLVTRVVHGGTVGSRAGIFLPSARLRPDLLGAKDLDDLALALEEGIDYVALSFVQAAEEVRDARRRLDRAGHPEVGVIAKIERAEALARLPPIIDAADAIMVARGDLGIEVPLERLALEQKRIAALANASAKPVIVATQVLLSMVGSPRPTRAEATDVANAVLDGADAVMLSEESAVGAYPVESVEWLERICRATEAAAFDGQATMAVHLAERPSPDGSVAAAAVELARALAASAIVVPTASGRTARLVAAHRPRVPVIALAPEGPTRRRLSLSWGVQTREAPPHLNLLELRALAARVAAHGPGVAPRGPLIVTAGYPLEGRPTNLVTVVEREEGRRSRPRRGPAHRDRRLAQGPVRRSARTRPPSARAPVGRGRKRRSAARRIAS